MDNYRMLKIRFLANYVFSDSYVVIGVCVVVRPDLSYLGWRLGMRRRTTLFTRHVLSLNRDGWSFWYKAYQSESSVRLFVSVR